MKIVIGDLALPTQADGSVFVHYAGHDINRYVSAVDVLEGRDDPDLIAGRIALVGVVGQGLVDYQLTPNGERLPGVEVHAEVIENIFAESLLRRPEAARGIEVDCFALLALMAVAWMPRMSPLQSAMTYLASASLRGPSSLGDLLEVINIELVRDNPDELFVTLLAVVLDLDTGQLEYCNAGHQPRPVVSMLSAASMDVPTGAGNCLPLRRMDTLPLEVFTRPTPAASADIDGRHNAATNITRKIHPRFIRCPFALLP